MDEDWVGIATVRGGGKERPDGLWKGEGYVEPTGRAVLIGALKAQLMDMAARKRMMNDSVQMSVCVTQTVYTFVHESHRVFCPCVRMCLHVCVSSVEGFTGELCNL